MLHEMQTGVIYQEQAPSAITELHQDYSLVDRTKITLLPCDPAETFVKKAKKYANHFDVIFISNALAHRVTDAVAVLEHGGHVIVESARYMLDLTKEQKEQFGITVNEMAEKAGLKRVEPIKLGADADFYVYTV